MSRSPITILEACADTHLFRSWFKDRATWEVWFVFLSALFALPMPAEQLSIYRQCTGRSEPPTSPATEGWLCCGRRAGKSFILALIAVFLACFHDYRQYLTHGERGVIFIIARDRKMARVILGYVRALLTGVPMLSRLIEREVAEGFDLTNSVSIEIGTSTYQSIRGRTLISALCDELAFWPSDNSASPDYEVLNALRPAMATIPNAMLLCASSPYARRGALWDAHRRHFGKDGDPILVWQADTRTMNPTVRQSVIDEAIQSDPANAASEFGGQFRIDIEAFIAREQVESCIERGVVERPFVGGTTYFSFIDPSGGSADAMTCAVGHLSKDKTMLFVDAVREIRAPFDPESAVDEIAQLLRLFKIHRTTGDRFASQWCAQSFEKRAIKYEHSEQNKSQLYIEMLPRLNAKTVRLLDHPRTINQICHLERRTSRGGRDSIDHPPNAHDDLANAIAGLCNLAARRSRYDSTMSWVSGPEDGDWNQRRFAAYIGSGGRLRW